MKLAGDRSYSDPDTTARKLIEIAKSVEAVQDGRIHIELINGTVSVRPEGVRRLNTGSASTWRSSAAGWRCTKSGTYVKFIQVGAELLA